MFSRSHVRMLRDPVRGSDVRERKCRFFFFSEGGTVQISDVPDDENTVRHEIL